MELEDKISRAQVIDVSKLSGKVVKFGATVTLIDEDTDQKAKYHGRQKEKFRGYKNRSEETLKNSDGTFKGIDACVTHGRVETYNCEADARPGRVSCDWRC